MRLPLIAVLLTALCHAPIVIANAADTKAYSPWSVTAGLYGGPAMLSAEFLQLPGFPNCCTPYSSGSGLTFGAQAGVELETGIRVFDKALKVNLTAGFGMMPGSVTQDEVVGNIISGDAVTDGVVRHQLDLTLSGVTIQPSILIPLPSINGLQLLIGGMGMVPMSAQVSQHQELTSPSSLDYTFENGQRIRAQQEGPLPASSSFLLWAVAGLRYELPLTEVWTLAPSVQYHQALTSVTSAESWTISSLQAGVMLSYRLPKPKPPEQPIVIEPPPPVRTPLLQSTVTIVARTPGSRMSADTIFAPVITENIVDTIQAIIPVLYFEQNSTTPVGGEVAMRKFAEAIRQSMADSTDQLEHVTITGSTSFDEDARLARERISRILHTASFDQNHLTVVQEKSAQKKYPELDTEGRFVRVALGTSPRVLHRYVEYKDVHSESVALSALHTLTCEAGPCTTTVAVHGAMPNTTTTTDPVIAITVPVPLDVEHPSRPTLVGVSLRTADSTGNVVTASSAVVVVPTVGQVHRQRVWINPTGVQQQHEYLLALFDFDGVTPTIVDPAVVTLTQEALHAGKRVTILPSTDSFGAADHNLELRKKRAQAGIELLGEVGTKVLLNLEGSSHELYGEVNGQAMRRSVWISIED